MKDNNIMRIFVLRLVSAMKVRSERSIDSFLATVRLNKTSLSTRQHFSAVIRVHRLVAVRDLRRDLVLQENIPSGFYLQSMVMDPSVAG